MCIRDRYIPIDREIFQGNAIAILNGYRLYSIMHDELRAVPVDSDIVKPLEKHCQSDVYKRQVRCLALLHGRSYLLADRHVGGRRLNQSHIRI